MSKAIGKNFFYNTIMIVLNIAFPIITAPYISRILGVNQIGKINFGNSFSGWFILLTSLGLPVYATREIARVRKDKKKLNARFNEILSLHILGVIVGVVIYFFVIEFNSSLILYKKTLIIYSLNLILSLFSLEWFYYGIENYKYISQRSVLFKVVALILMFLFVKTAEDYYKYLFIIIFGLGASNILNLINVKKIINIKITFNREVIKQLNYSKIFYFQILLGSVYIFIDQIILGIGAETSQVAFYSRSKQIIMVSTTLVLSFAKTITPRLANYYINNKIEYEKILKFSFKLTNFILWPIVVIIAMLSEEIMVILGGKEFLEGALILRILSIIIIFSVYATFLDTQISLPSGNEKNTLYGNIGVATVSLLLNLMLVKKYGGMGTAISVIFGEIVGVIIQYVRINKQKLDININIVCLIKYIMASFFMGIVIMVCKEYIVQEYIKKLILTGIIAILSYAFFIFLISKIFKDENEISYIIHKIKRSEKN